MPDYTLGKIYKICSNNPDIVEVYYGSTTQTLCSRMSGHRAKFKLWNNDKTNRSCSIFHCFEQYGIEQFHIELVENYSCENKEQLLSYENKFIRDNECINKRASIQTVEERKEKNKQYRQDNKEKILEYQKQYYQEKSEDYFKQYYQDNKEKITEYQKQLYQENKEKIIARTKQYHQDNKDKINEQRRQRYQAKKESI